MVRQPAAHGRGHPGHGDHAATTSVTLPTAPAGWSTAFNIGNYTTTPHAFVACFCKVAAGSDAAPSITVTTSGTTRVGTQLFELSGGDVLVPVDVSGTYASGTGSATLASWSFATSAVVTAASEYAIVAYAREQATAAAATFAVTDGSTLFTTSGAESSSRDHDMVSYKASPTSGSVFTASGTVTSAATSYAAGGVAVFAIPPETSPSLELYGFAIPAPASADTINSVTVAITEYQSCCTDPCTFSLWDYSGTPAQIGTTQTGTASTSSSNVSSATFTGVTYAMLATLRVQVFGNAAAGSSYVESVDGLAWSSTTPRRQAGIPRSRPGPAPRLNATATTAASVTALPWPPGPGPGSTLRSPPSVPVARTRSWPQPLAPRSHAFLLPGRWPRPAQARPRARPLPSPLTPSWLRDRDRTEPGGHRARAVLAAGAASRRLCGGGCHAVCVPGGCRAGICSSSGTASAGLATGAGAAALSAFPDVTLASGTGAAQSPAAAPGVNAVLASGAGTSHLYRVPGCHPGFRDGCGTQPGRSPGRRGDCCRRNGRCRLSAFPAVSAATGTGAALTASAQTVPVVTVTAVLAAGTGAAASTAFPLTSGLRDRRRPEPGRCRRR